MRFSASIIGAGTAGLISARELAKRGIDAEVYDQKAVPGLPVRASGIVSFSGIDSLGIEYSSCMTNRLYGATIHAGGRSLRIRSRNPVAAVLDRHKLNEKCIDDAQAAGAKVNLGRRVVGADLDRMANGGVVIGADGALSATARHFGLGEIGKITLTYKAVFNVDVQDPGMVELFFDRKEYPGLFAWLCPNDKDLLEVGVGIISKNTNAKAAYRKLLRDKRVGEILGNAKAIDENASIIPMRLRGRIVDAKRKVLLVGDAAGQVKAATGGGIVYGGNAALIAADTIAKYYETGYGLREYEARYRKAYGFDMLLHSAINRLYSAVGTYPMGTALMMMERLGIGGFLSEYGDMDSPSLILRRFFLRKFA